MERFEEQVRNIEESRRRFVERKELRRSFLEVRFAGFDEAGCVVVTIKNLTDKGMAGVRGGIVAEDTRGDPIAGTAFTEGVPGGLFLAGGETKERTPFGRPRSELADRLRADPDSVVFSFGARAITYADGSEELEL